MCSPLLLYLAALHCVSASGSRRFVKPQSPPACSVVQVSLPSFDLAAPAYYVLALSEASSNLARYDGVRYGLSCQAGPPCSSTAACICPHRSLCKERCLLLLLDDLPNG